MLSQKVEGWFKFVERKQVESDDQKILFREWGVKEEFLLPEFTSFPYDSTTKIMVKIEN